MRRSLVESPFFDEIRPYIKVQDVRNEAVDKAPRHRIELASNTPHDLVLRALAYRYPCVACGQMVPVFRRRKQPGNKRNTWGAGPAVYVAVACELQVNMGCARGSAASDEYLRIVAAVRQTAGPVQTRLI